MCDANDQQHPGGFTVPQVARILPGPAGKLQQLAAAGALHQATPELLGLKDQYIPSAQNNDILADPCFQSSTWIEANRFASSQDSQLHTIKMAKALSLSKVPLMVVVLGAVQPSGMNSAFCKVKDPTGSIGAALHCSVLQHQQYQLGRLVPGSVVLLQRVSVFTPTPGVSYLAVTATNLIKVWSGESADDRIRHAQHQPAQQQQQQQQQQQTQQQEQGQRQQQQQQQQLRGHGTQNANKSQGRPPHITNTAGLTQPRVQTQQQQQHHMQAGSLQQEQQQQRRLQQQQDSPSMAGSNRSSLYPPPSPDVSSIFSRPQQQPAGQQSKQGLQSQHLTQQQRRQHDKGQAADDGRQVGGNHMGRGFALEQQQPAATPHVRGLMPPPAPRIQASDFRAQVQQQQQTQTPNVAVRPPHGRSQAAQQHTSSMQPQLLDSLIEDLEDLDEEDDGDVVGAASHPAAAAASTGVRMHRGLLSAGRQPAMQQHLQHNQQEIIAVQQQQSGSQFVPGALLEQIAGAGSAAGPASRTPLMPNAAAVGGAAAAVGGGSGGAASGFSVNEGEDAVDDVVAAIFGSQMAPEAAPVTTTRPPQAAAAAASIFGKHLAAPAVPGPGGNSTQPGSMLLGPAQTHLSQHPMWPPSTPGVHGFTGTPAPAAGYNTADCLPNSSGTGGFNGNWDGTSHSGIAISANALTAQDQPNQKRFKAATAVNGVTLQPSQPLSRNVMRQQHITYQQQRGSLSRQPSSGWPGAYTPASGATQSTFVHPAVSGVGVKGAGPACLLDDLVDDELEELDCL